MSAKASAFVTPTALEACFEFVCYATPPDECGLPSEPGQIRRDAEGRATLLHFAPRRWLVPTPGAALHAWLADLESQGHGALIDIDGKWQLLRIAEPSRILGSSINVEATLRHRQCAAATVFDCPAILAGDETTVDLWVASSYLESFLSALVGQ
jgi:hypothetical protein